LIGKAIVIGASGYVGQRLLHRLGERGHGTYASRPKEGLAHFDAMTESAASLIERVGAEVSHVFVPYGAIDPERCARDPAGTMAVNIVSVVRLLEDVLSAGAVPVFFSTDYVFDGVRGGYSEDDEAVPRTSYGVQKRAVELWLGTIAKPWLTVRLSKVVGLETDTHSVIGQWVSDIKAGKPQRCATDQVFCPAWVDDIARALVDLCDRRATGVWHVAGHEAFSRHDLLAMLIEEIRKVEPSIHVDLTPCSLHDLPFLEKRPLNTSMVVDRLGAALDWRFRTMRDLCREAAQRHFSPGPAHGETR